MSVELEALLSRCRQIEEEREQLAAERVSIEVQVELLRKKLEQAAAFQPAPHDEALARRCAKLLACGDKPHDFQIRAACALHAGRDVIVVEQAGKGKSVCFQLAGLMQRAPFCPRGPAPAQLTVVVSPLVALAHEQHLELNAVRKCKMGDGSIAALAYILDGGAGDVLTVLVQRLSVCDLWGSWEIESDGESVAECETPND